MARCPNCGEDNPERARFCLNCATPLTPAATPGEERKVVTVLFADVTGSTALGERLDPEHLKEIMGAYFEAMREEIEGQGGTVEKFIGDAVMAVFGVPAAHEDDPARALRAALRMRERLAELNRDLASIHGVELAARIGVNTGEVVAVTDPRPGEGLVTGDAVNVAARLEQAAAPGHVVVSERTARAVRGFRFGRLDPMALRGKGEPVPAVELLGMVEAPVAERGVPGLFAPLVGREQELALLKALYERATGERRPHLVTIYGDPGVGKSRLTREFLAWAEQSPHPPDVLMGRCLPYGRGITYWPLAEILKAQAGMLDTDPPAIALEKVRKLSVELLEGLVPDARRTAAALAYTVGLEDPDLRFRDLAPRQVRLEVHGAWRSFFSALALERPVVAVIEDIHWADPALLDLLDEMADRAEGSLLIVCPSRLELTARRPGWGGGRRTFASIVLDPLSETESARLVELLLAVEDLPESLRERMLERAEGNPFFLEEIIRKLVDEGHIVHDEGRWRASAGVGEVTIPDTVQGVLAARVDLLKPAEKRVLQMAAVVGRVFWTGPVARLMGDGSSGDHPDLDETLDGLEDRELVRSRVGTSMAGEREYAFKHILTRDVAYETLPRRERTRAHAEVARWIEQTAGERYLEFVELLAHHFGEAHAGAREDPRTDPGMLQGLRASTFRYLLEGSADARSKLVVEKAVQLGEAALAIAATPEDRSRALEAVGLAYQWNYQGDLAWRFLRDAVDALREDPSADPEEVARLCAEALEVPTRWPGSMQSKVPQEEARRYLDLGLSSLPPQGETRARMLIARSFWPFAFPELAVPDELRRAREAGEEAAAIAEGLGQPGLASAALDGIGATYIVLGHYGPDWHVVERRLEIARTIEDPWELGDIFAVAAWNRWSVGRYREALEYSDHGVRRTIADVPGVALHCLAWRAVSRWRLGEWDALPEDLARAEEILGDRRETPPPFATILFGALALVEEVRSRPAAAERFLTLLSRVDQAKIAARWVSGCLALVEARRGEGEAARNRLLKTLETSAGAHGFVLEALCGVVEEGHLWEEAKSVAAQARSWAAEAGLEALPVFADRLEGHALAATGQVERGADLLHGAVRDFDRLEARWDAALARLALAEALKDRDRAAEALAVFEELGAVKESLRARELLA